MWRTEDWAELRRALDDPEHREALATSPGPVAAFLRRAGAYHQARYEEVDYTDWNGALVGRGAGAELRAAIPPDPTLPAADLVPLLGLGAFARELVARHPATPLEPLLVLAGDPEWSVQAAVLERTGNPEPVLGRLRASSFAGIRVHFEPAPPPPPRETEAALRAAAGHPDEAVRWGVARRPRLPPDLMDQLAVDPAVEVRRALARRADLSEAARARLLAHELDPGVVAALAESPSTPPEVLEWLCHAALPALPFAARAASATPPWPTTSAEVRALIAGRAGLPSALAQALARDADPRVRGAVAGNPAVDPALLDTLLDDPDVSVRTALAGNPRFTELALLATDPSPDVGSALVARADAPPEALALLARNVSSAVRARVAAREDAPRALLERLAEDGQTLVRRAAAEALATRASRDAPTVPPVPSPAAGRAGGDAAEPASQEAPTGPARPWDSAPVQMRPAEAEGRSEGRLASPHGGGADWAPRLLRVLGDRGIPAEPALGVVVAAGPDQVFLGVGTLGEGVQLLLPPSAAALARVAPGAAVPPSARLLVTVHPDGTLSAGAVIGGATTVAEALSAVAPPGALARWRAVLQSLPGGVVRHRTRMLAEERASITLTFSPRTAGDEHAFGVGLAAVAAHLGVERTPWQRVYLEAMRPEAGSPHDLEAMRPEAGSPHDLEAMRPEAGSPHYWEATPGAALGVTTEAGPAGPLARLALRFGSARWDRAIDLAQVMVDVAGARGAATRMGTLAAVFETDTVRGVEAILDPVALDVVVWLPLV